MVRIDSDFAVSLNPSLEQQHRRCRLFWRSLRRRHRTNDEGRYDAYGRSHSRLRVCLTVKLRGRTEAPALGAEGAQSLSARGDNQEAHHGPLQRLLGDNIARVRDLRSTGALTV